MFYCNFTQKVNVSAVFEVKGQRLKNAALGKSTSSYFLSLHITLVRVFKPFGEVADMRFVSKVMFYCIFTQKVNISAVSEVKGQRI